MGLSPFTCCSCLRQCNAGVAVQLEETILTLQSKITIAIFLNWLTLLFIPSSAFCSNSQSVVTVIALFLQEADFTRLQLLHLSYLCININYFFFEKLNFHGKQPKGAASPRCRSRGARTITAGRWGVSHAMSLRFREGRTVRNVMISGWTWTCDPWMQPFLIFFSVDQLAELLAEVRGRAQFAIYLRAHLQACRDLFLRAKVKTR